MGNLVYLFLVMISQNEANAAQTCSEKKVAEILEKASSQQNNVKIDCSVKLPQGQKITKRLLFEGQKSSEVTFDCNGSELHGGSVNQGKDLIQVLSLKTKNSKGNMIWQRPENITIKNCSVHGSVRILGMAANGEGVDLRDSSRSLGHTDRAQNNAPKGIRLEKMKIFGQSRIPLYFSPGVTHSGLYNSEIAGKSTSVAIYMDAESAYNTLKNNSIHTDTEKRELIAIDGSAYNKIIGNRLSSLNNGGIYMYRNCGEGGTVRHQSPVENQIINNVFYYKKYNGATPAIWVASRNGQRNYCAADNGYPFGSSANNNDLAHRNIIAQNQFYKFQPEKMIRLHDQGTELFANQKISETIYKKSGCYLKGALPSAFLYDGQSTQQFTVNSQVVCKENKYTCNDGTIETKAAKCTEVPLAKTISFDCQATSSNGGCAKTVYCPVGQRMVSARAACNLESGRVSQSDLNSLQQNQLKVVKASDKVTQGECHVGREKISQGSSSLLSVFGESSIPVSCKEHDKNGGDCHIAGQIICQDF